MFMPLDLCGRICTARFSSWKYERRFSFLLCVWIQNRDFCGGEVLIAAVDPGEARALLKGIGLQGDKFVGMMIRLVLA